MNTPGFPDKAEAARLPSEARDALARLTGENATNDDFFQAIVQLRNARQNGAARRVLDLLATRLDAARDLRFRLTAALLDEADGLSDRALEALARLRQEHPSNVHAFRMEFEILARHGNYAAALDVLRATPLNETLPMNADNVFRGLRLSIYLAAAGSKPVFADPAPAAPVEAAVAVMMIRDEEDVIGQNLRHHYRLGFRKFVILLNCCTDRTEALVEAFGAEHKDAMLVSMVDPTTGYYQAGKTQSAIDFARAYFAAIRRPVEWCFILDADEFVSIDGELGLAGLLARAEEQGKAFITFHLCNATSSAAAEFEGQPDIYGFFDVIAGCEVPLVTKNAFRTTGNFTIGMGNHVLLHPALQMDNALIAAQHGARLVHMPYRSRAQIRTKIVNGATVYEATDLDEAMGRHWRRQYRRYLDEGDAAVEKLLAEFHRLTMHAAAQQLKFFL